MIGFFFSWRFLVVQSKGVTAVREGDGVTLADERVQRLIQRRIEGYPDKADSETHRARFVVFDVIRPTRLTVEILCQER